MILITQLKYSPSPLDYFENCYVSVLRQRDITKLRHVPHRTLRAQ